MKRVKALTFAVFAAIMSIAQIPVEAQNPAIGRDGSSIDARIESLLSQLTLEEKVSLLHANSTFATAGVPRLGIPELTMDDGPMGVREDVGANFSILNRTDDYATALPASIALAATWNAELAKTYGRVVGEEALARGKHIMLSPAVNIQRTPLCGRNFEYYGEDPYLTSRIAVNYIQGEQIPGVASCIKHFAANNQETQRGSINVEMDERALREIYLPAFKAAVQEAGAMAVMGAYNKFRGQYCCENDYLLNKVLKGEWGFKGVVISDWGGTHSTDGAALNGLDIEMGSRQPFEQNFLAAPYLAGLKSGNYPMSVLDDKVRRHLYVMAKLGLLDPAPSTAPGDRKASLNTREHQMAARQVAEESCVLLKNDGAILPLDASQIKSIAIIGDNAVGKFSHSGAGAVVKSFYEVTILEGIINRVGNRANVSYSAGFAVPIGGRGGRGRGAPAASQPDAEELRNRAIQAAKTADVVIYVGGLNHTGRYDSEGSDRPDLKLPFGQDELISQIVAANPKTIIVLMTGAAIEMDPWLAKAPAVLEAWYPGMEGGNALARLLFGDVSPSGKLPCTFPKKLEDSPAHATGNFPGQNGVVKYEEGILVGYRWFDTKNIDPLFPFGHGLSYTKFEYSNLKLTPGTGADGPLVNVEFEISNTGPRPGSEVAQIYIHDAESSLPRPEKELKGFRKIALQPGEKQTISVPLDRSAFSFYDPNQSGWVSEKGDFTISVGSSSRDIRMTTRYELSQTTLQK